MNKKVLIITYYWPPSGGAGVQRWLKFTKYLPDFGWTPIIYTPENPEMPSEDLSLMKDIPNEAEVLKTKIWEPYNAYKKFVGSKKDEKINAGFLTESTKPKRTEKLAVWVRGNFFIPDARKFWIKPSIKYLVEYLKENPVDAIVSTGPPHSMHLIALELKRKLNVKWIADFRDPWTNIDFYEDLMLSKLADRKHKRLESEVLQEADIVLTVGETLGKELQELGANNVQVITNGFDVEAKKQSILLDEKFSIAHIGSMVKTRNPIILWEALKELVKENNGIKADLEIKLVGKVDISIMESLKFYGLEAYVKKIDYLPHEDVITEQRKSKVLLLVVNDTPNAKGILTGKFFEYLAAERPILCIGPKDGDVADVLSKTGNGLVCDRDNLTEVKEVLLKLYRGEEYVCNKEEIEKYSRKNLTKNLVELLDS